MTSEATGATEATEAPGALLAARGLGKSFAGVPALVDVHLEVRHGEILGLAGANGAGKSTLINLLPGHLHSDTGELFIEGKRVSVRSPRDAHRAGIGVVRQELDLVPHLTIAENLFLGDERRFAKLGVLDRRAMSTAARALLSRVVLENDPAAVVRTLSIGDRQLVAAARALRDAGRCCFSTSPRVR